MLSGARADEIDEEMLRNSIKNADAVILMNGDNVSSDLVRYFQLLKFIQILSRKLQTYQMMK
jgi:hypothetical protein